PPQASQLSTRNFSGQTFITWKEIPNDIQGCGTCWNNSKWTNPATWLDWDLCTTNRKSTCVEECKTVTDIIPSCPQAFSTSATTPCSTCLNQAKFFDNTLWPNWTTRDWQQEAECTNPICKHEKSYRIYRLNQPITSSNLHQAELIDQVYQGSSWISGNVYEAGGSTNYQPDPTSVRQPNLSRAGVSLSTDSGLYVFTNEKNETAYYAVTSVVNGNENRNITPGSNATSSGEGITERIAHPQPFYFESYYIYKGYIMWLGSFNFLDSADKYGFDNRRSAPVFFSVVTPQDNKTLSSYPLTLSLHSFSHNMYESTEGTAPSRGEFNGYTIDFNDFSRMIARNDAGKLIDLGTYIQMHFGYSLYSGWNSNYTPTKISHGFVPTFRLAKPFNEGKSVLYAQKAMRTITQWVADHSKFFTNENDLSTDIDRKRIYATGGSMGGGGSVNFALFNPDLVAAINVVQGYVSFSTSRMRIERIPASFGSETENIPTPEGVGIFDELSAAKKVLSNPGANWPAMRFRHGKNDSAVTWTQMPPFYSAAKEARLGLSAYFSQDDHNQASDFNQYFGTEYIGDFDFAKVSTAPLDRSYKPGFNLFAFRKDLSFPAFSNFSLNANPGTGSPTDGEPRGRINTWPWFDSASIAETYTSYTVKVYMLSFTTNSSVTQATVSITPRNIQKLKHHPGTRYAWKTTDSTGRTLQTTSAPLYADKDGLLTIPGVTIYKNPITLTINVTSDAIGPIPPSGLHIQD
ncbi:MAG: hypothetical protein GYA55_04020, partial [SAR324 cluster bacterium]|nr:hypothetical protein [SAR324 cluster bacterium]